MRSLIPPMVSLLTCSDRMLILPITNPMFHSYRRDLTAAIAVIRSTLFDSLGFLWRFIASYFSVLNYADDT